MAGYSGTPLVRKLGLKPASLARVINPPDNYPQLLADAPADVEWQEGPAGALDFVHFFTRQRAELAAFLPELREAIFPDGMIWVSWPKKASKVETDVTENTVREIALPLGLVDIKVCAVDEIWSGLKLVVRKELRK